MKLKFFRTNPVCFRILVLGSALALSVSTGLAGLRWENTVVERAAKPGESIVEVPFSFTVEGAQAVQILDAETSCGCTVATLDKRLYKPGETGSIVARFTPGDRQGRQEKQVTVKLMEAGVEHRATLTLRVSIPSLLTLEKKRLEWTRGENPEAKSVRITTVSGVTVRLKPLDPENAQYVKLELQPDSGRAGYTLTATPQEGRAPGIMALFFQAELDGRLVASAPLILRFR